MTYSLQNLFDKPMNRRQFLAHIGIAILAIIGVNGLFKQLLDFRSTPRHQVVDNSAASSYGDRSK